MRNIENISKPCFRALSLLIILISGLSLITGCAEKMQRRYPLEGINKDSFDIAEAYRKKGKWDMAIREYKRYADTHPGTDKAISALVSMADIYVQKGDLKKALSLYRTICNKRPDYIEIPAIRYKMIKALYLSGDIHDSVRAALDWLNEYQSHPLKRQVMLALIDDYSSLGLWEQAFEWWKRIRDTDENRSIHRQELQHRLKELLADYEKSIKAKGAPPIKTEDWVLEARKIIHQADGTYGQVIKIGCLLPLTGPFAPYGQDLLNGIELGSGLITDHDYTQDYEIYIADTGGKPEKAVSALDELSEEGVVGVIGPISSNTATYAGKRAQELGIPIITITQKEGIEKEGDMVFRDFLTPSREIKVLVTTAINKLGITRFAILYPENHYGLFLKNKFWDMVYEMGGEITEVESYDPDATDFSEQIKKMAGMDNPEETDREHSKQSQDNQEEDQEEEKPVVDFEAIFIPDNDETVAMIAPQLPYYDVDNVLILGTSACQPKKLIDLARDYVQGAIFTTGFFKEKDDPMVRYFVKQYRANFGKEPGLMAAYGFDTIRLLRKIIEEGGIYSREDLQRRLSQYCDFEGVTGKICFSRDGDNMYGISLITIKGNRAVLFEENDPHPLSTNNDEPVKDTSHYGDEEIVHGNVD